MNKIKELRKEKNITVAELAKELGISQSMLTNYENGNGTPRDESIWEKLSQIFGVSKSHVMGLTTDIETANKTKQLKVVVDTSQPISIQPKNQTDLDVLIKLDLIDSEDMEEVSEFLINCWHRRNMRDGENQTLNMSLSRKCFSADHLPSRPAALLGTVALGILAER